MNDVFISYSREDRPTAERLHKMLEASGLSVSYDQSALVAGDDFSEEVLNKLINARAVVVLLSGRSKQDKWIGEESRSALEKSTGIIIPVLLDGDATNNWIWPLVSNHSAIRVTAPEKLNEVAQVIEHFVKRSPGWNPDSDALSRSLDDGVKRRRGIRNLLSFSFSSKVASLGIVLVMLAVTVSVYQYNQSGYSTRIAITEIWARGYTTDTRNRIDKFVSNYRSWKQRDPEGAEASLNILIDPDKLFDGEVIRADRNLAVLLATDIEEKEATDNDYVEAALKYRNAIIEFLNTGEAVKATIRTEPRWFKNPDPLEEQYESIIIQRTNELRDFIEMYRHYNRRPTPAWQILTENSR